MALGIVLGSGGGGSLEKCGESNQPIYIDVEGDAQVCTEPLNISTQYVDIQNDTTDKLYVLGAKNTGKAFIYRESSVYLYNNVLYGGAWNDFAEYRYSEEATPGTVVCESNNAILSPSTKRLQKGASIVSDTFGFIVGKKEENTSPIAIAGRVLAKTDNSKLKVGDTVCTGKNGTVSKMNRLEIILFPDRIVGIVSEIPTYTMWNDISINGRIWVKVK